MKDNFLEVFNKSSEVVALTSEVAVLRHALPRLECHWDLQPKYFLKNSRGQYIFYLQFKLHCPHPVSKNIGKEVSCREIFG
jgi:hypothetical protein